MSHFWQNRYQQLMLIKNSLSIIAAPSDDFNFFDSQQLSSAFIPLYNW
jgi:hypothetical protein